MAAKKCYSAGDHYGMQEVFHLILIYILATICMIEIILFIFLTIKELPKRTHYLKKFKIFMVPLLVTDFLIGCVFVLLFVLEATKDGKDVECDVSIWRIIGYLYYLTTRGLAIAYILLLTYRKTRGPLPTPVQRESGDAFTFVINISLLWSPGISAIICFGFSSVETNAIMAFFTLVYFCVTMSCTITCHYWVYNALTRDKIVTDDSAFTDTKYYRQAIKYVTMSFVAFAAVNGALMLIGVIFVVHSFRGEHADESRTMQDLYLSVLLIAAVESIGNPVCFVNRIHKVKKGLCKTCSIIMFTKRIDYQKSFKLGFQQERTSSGRPRAALSVAENKRDEEAKRLASSLGEDDVFDGDEYGKCTDDHSKDAGSSGVKLDGKNNDITLAAEGKPKRKFYDEAGIEIEDDGIFDNDTNDVTLATEAEMRRGSYNVFANVGEVEIDFPEPQIFGDWRNHAWRS